MKARRSMSTSHRHSFKYLSPVVTGKLYVKHGREEDQENTPPRSMDASIGKRRKLYNGQPIVDNWGQSMDMEISTAVEVTTPKTTTHNALFFTPPSRGNPPHILNGCTGSLSTPRSSYTKPRTIQEVMRNVTVYVEVLTIDEDRSDKIKSVAAAMGARVNDKLYKNTTHVIFREGSMTTYKKALKMNIPLVSVTWLEECRKTLSLCDPSRFPPINLEPYEHPELYKRVRKVNPSNGEVATTPERFALKPTRPEDDFERRLKEYQQTKIRLEMDSPVASTSNLGKTVLNFSPIGESTKITAAPKTPSQSNMTPLLRRLMIRNAEDDKRERANIITGRTGGGTPKPLPVLDESRTGRMSMDLTALWGGSNDTDHRILSMVQETVDLISSSPDESPSQPRPPANKPTPNGSSIMQALRRQTMLFTSTSASMDISPMAAMENVADDQGKTVYNLSVEAIEGNLEAPIKVPKICGTQRKSLEEDTLRDDIVRAKEELLGKAVVINKSDKRRSLLPSSFSTSAADESMNNKTNRRRTLFSVAAISEGGLSPPGPKKVAAAKTASKRKTLLSSLDVVDEVSSQGEVKKLKKSVTGKPPIMASQGQRRVTNMGPPEQIPAIKTKVTATSNTATSNPKTPINKRKLFSSLAELSPVASPKRPSIVSKANPLPHPPVFSEKLQSFEKKSATGSTTRTDSKAHAVERKTTISSKGRRSTMDFQQTSAHIANSSAMSSSGRGSNAPGSGMRGQKNVIVLTNGHQQQLDFIKELVDRMGHSNYEVDTRVTSKTTHLVCFEKKRNMNMLRGVIRGVWVLDYDWIVDSSKMGRWQREEDYQVKIFGNTLTKVRSEREAFGKHYKMELFTGTGNFYVHETTTVPTHHLKELIMLCGGIVVDKPADAKYIIADIARTDGQVVSPSWLFDSVCQYTFLNHKKYFKKL